MNTLLNIFYGVSNDNNLIINLVALFYKSSETYKITIIISLFKDDPSM